jgi:hypothetical protein
MTESTMNTSEPIPYATPATRPSRVAPAVWIAIIGLALIGFGGCFLIGILMTEGLGLVTVPPPTASLVFYRIVLYATAFGCFGGAIFMIVKSLKALYTMLNA